MCGCVRDKESESKRERERETRRVRVSERERERERESAQPALAMRIQWAWRELSSCIVGDMARSANSVTNRSLRAGSVGWQSALAMHIQ